MKDAVFITLIVTGFTVAFLHAVMPTHWLPFVVAARAQRWNKAKTLTVTGVAGAGHVLFTTALGVLVVWSGIAINNRFGRTFPLIAGGGLIAIGVLYLLRQFKAGHGHVHLFGCHSHHEQESHSHYRQEHEHEHADHHQHEDETDEIEKIEEQWSHRRSDSAVVAGLLVLLTFSPCEAFLPVFPIGAKYRLVRFYTAQFDTRRRNGRGHGRLHLVDVVRPARSPIEIPREL